MGQFLRNNKQSKLKKDEIHNLNSPTNIKEIEFVIKKLTKGLPWWCSGWESACQCGGRGFEPWSGGVPHAAEQLGL